MKQIKNYLNISFWHMGLVYLFLSILQQFLVNYIVITSILALAISLFFLYARRDNKKLVMLFTGVIGINALGLFIHRFTMLSILGLLSFALGLVFSVAGLLLKYKKSKRIVNLILCTVISIIFVFASGLLSLTTIRPDITMGWMGDSVQPVENVIDAVSTESRLDNGIFVKSNIKYDTELPNGFLDIYYAPNAYEKTPTLVFIHGGGYVWGDKVGGDPNAENSNFDHSTGAHFLEKGYNVVQMNYALAPDYPFPNAIKQLNRGLKYLVDHADELNINMENIVIGGGSAGGNLAGTLINVQTNPQYAELLNETPAIDSKSIKAAVFEGGLFDNSRFGKTGSVFVDWSFLQLGRIYLQINELATNEMVVTPSNVLDFVTSEFVPSFISDGNTGTFTDQAIDMYEKLSKLGVDCRLNLFLKDEAPLVHGFEESGSKYAEETFTNMFEFLSNYVMLD